MRTIDLLAGGLQPDSYALLNKVVSVEVLGSVAYGVWELIGELQGSDNVEPNVLLTLCNDLQRPLVEELIAYDKELPPNMLRATADKIAYQAITTLTDAYARGDSVSLLEQSSEIIDQINGKLTGSIGDTTMDLLAMDLSEAEQSNLEWNTRILRDDIKRPDPGRHILIGALGNVGKTSFMLDLAKTWAKADEGDILLFLNEGSPEEYARRASTVLLNKNIDDVMAMPLEQRAAEMNKAGAGRLKLIGAHGWQLPQIHAYIDKYKGKVAAVFIDMIANAVPGGASASEKARKLEEAHIACRSHAIIQKYVSVVTSRLSNDAVGIAYPHMNMLKDAKIGVAAQTDLMIMLSGNEGDCPAGFLAVNVSVPRSKITNIGCTDPADATTYNRFTGCFN